MATDSTTPLNLYRANLGLALRMLGCGHEYRRQACEFEMLRIKRDLAALNATRDAATGAHDWSELAAGYQTMLRDYMAATTNLWQQGLVSAARHQTACSDDMRDALAGWQAAWTGNWQQGAGMNLAALPLQDWMRRFEQTVRNALDCGAPFGRRTDSATPPATARRFAPPGEQHVG
ncbi:hypothetical protein [Paraburkholderia sp. MM5384-R2]|uniref:hypothetical protein n=1 Tax=Paraburkholderia sp. MM5384-R2 TaxID=2723097 RepID=UPI00161B6FD6|nr:hypothetical protein [Paraburkholderia sp. MM5384-R2]MBB5496020.1 hypothetical protein [Paraburkholderia sp. MM5384-R2]